MASPTQVRGREIFLKAGERGEGRCVGATQHTSCRAGASFGFAARRALAACKAQSALGRTAAKLVAVVEGGEAGALIVAGAFAGAGRVLPPHVQPASLPPLQSQLHHEATSNPAMQRTLAQPQRWMGPHESRVHLEEIFNKRTPASASMPHGIT